MPSTHISKGLGSAWNRRSPLFDSLEAIGKARTQSRVRQALAVLKA